MITNPDNKPPVGGMGGSIHSWERGISPWHRDAFPSEFKYAAPEQSESQFLGWIGLDWCGNIIAFVHDGTYIKEIEP